MNKVKKLGTIFLYLFIVTVLSTTFYSGKVHAVGTTVKSVTDFKDLVTSGSDYIVDARVYADCKIIYTIEGYYTLKYGQTPVYHEKPVIANSKLYGVIGRFQNNIYFFSSENGNIAGIDINSGSITYQKKNPIEGSILEGAIDAFGAMWFTVEKEVPEGYNYHLLRIAQDGSYTTQLLSIGADRYPLYLQAANNAAWFTYGNTAGQFYNLNKVTYSNGKLISKTYSLSGTIENEISLYKCDSNGGLWVQAYGGALYKFQDSSTGLNLVSSYRVEETTGENLQSVDLDIDANNNLWGVRVIPSGDTFKLRGWKLENGKIIDKFEFSNDMICVIRTLDDNNVLAVSLDKYSVIGETNIKVGWVKNLKGQWTYYSPLTGKLLSGWQLIGGRNYYLDPLDGTMKTGWLRLGSTWYYLDSNGAMKTGWVLVNNIWYYMDSSGAMKTGWVRVNNKWYYMGSGGAMKTGWVQVSNNWYYMDSSGVMKTGWLQVGGYWYYFYQDGRMARNTIISGIYKIDANGVWVK